MIRVWEIVGRTVSIILEVGTSKEVDISNLHKIMKVEGGLEMVIQKVDSKLAGMRAENPKIKVEVREMELGNHRRDKIMEVEREMLRVQVALILPGKHRTREIAKVGTNPLMTTLHLAAVLAH